MGIKRIGLVKYPFGRLASQFQAFRLWGKARRIGQRRREQQSKKTREKCFPSLRLTPPSERWEQANGSLKAVFHMIAQDCVIR